VGVDPVVGKLAIIFRGLFALATRDGNRKENRRVRYSMYLDTVFRYLALSDKKRYIGLFIKSPLQNSDVIYHVNITNIKRL